MINYIRLLKYVRDLARQYNLYGRANVYIRVEIFDESIGDFMEVADMQVFETQISA